MNTHLKQLWAAMKLPEKLQKSYKFFCRGLDIRVTQIVKAHPAQAVALQKFRKCVGQVFHPHPLAQLIHEYKAIVFIVVAVAADLLVQLLRLFHLHKVFPEAADERQGAQTGLGLGGLLLELLILAVDDR